MVSIQVEYKVWRTLTRGQEYVSIEESQIGRVCIGMAVQISLQVCMKSRLLVHLIGRSHGVLCGRQGSIYWWRCSVHHSIFVAPKASYNSVKKGVWALMVSSKQLLQGKTCLPCSASFDVLSTGEVGSGENSTLTIRGKFPSLGIVPASKTRVSTSYFRCQFKSLHTCCVCLEHLRLAFILQALRDGMSVHVPRNFRNHQFWMNMLLGFVQKMPKMWGR